MRITMPLGLLPLLMTAGTYFLSVRKDICNGPWYYFFIFSIILFFSSLIVTSFFLKRAYYGYKYNYLPKPSEIDKYTNNLASYAEKVITYKKKCGLPSDTKDQIIRDKLDSFYYNSYIKAIDNNISMNEKKLKNLWMAGIFLLISVIAAALCLLPVTFAKNDKVIKVEIISPSFCKGGAIMTDKEKHNPPEEPPPPPLRQVQESFEKDINNKNVDNNEKK